MNYSAAALPASICPEDAPSPSITYRLAATHAELEQAFALVCKAYTKVGLHQADETGLRLTKYHLLPDTKVFIAVAQSEKLEAGKIRTEEKVIGTLSVVHDGCLGLPAEEISKKQIISMRNQGSRMAEMIALANDQEGTDNRVIIKLLRLAYEYCRTNGVTQIIASLTKHHIGFYRRFTGFRPLGELKEYTMANGIPVQVHELPVEESFSLVEKRSSALFSDYNWRFFWEQDAERILMDAKRMRPWCHEKIQYFASRHPCFFGLIDISSAGALSQEYERLGCEFSIAP